MFHRYFAGEIEFGTISQTSFAFSSINQALSIIITNLGQVGTKPLHKEG
jgi:ABC-type uncharacterized transport system fused permease/ATPase subunit